MGVQLNIKDVETVELARSRAEKLGKSVTSTIRKALEEKAERRAKEREATIEAMKAISERFRANMPAEWHGMTSRRSRPGSRQTGLAGRRNRTRR